MAEDLQGTEPRRRSWREDARAQRITRSRFIGHWIGLTIIGLLVGGGLYALGQTRPYQIPGQPEPVPLLNPVAGTVLMVVLTICLADLVIRRRHDRNRRSIGGIIWLLLVLATYVVVGFELIPAYAIWLAGATALVSLYMLVVLAILPGTKGDNRYGPDPRAR